MTPARAIAVPAVSVPALPAKEDSLPGRASRMPVPERHFVNGRTLEMPCPGGLEVTYLGLGCFWGAERLFWTAPGVHVTSVGYAGGHTPNPTYEEVCTGQTGHAEIVLVAFDPLVTDLEAILRLFWENHDPTQGMRQGGDIGTQYRSALYVMNETQRMAAFSSRDLFQRRLTAAGLGRITTEIRPAPAFYFAEPCHQQYLAKNPGGYCGLAGTGVSYPIELAAALGA